MVPYLYKPEIKADTVVWAIIDWALEATKNHDYAQSAPRTPALCNSELDRQPETMKSLLDQAAWQHHFGYLYGLDMLQPTGSCPFLKEDGCSPNLATIFCQEDAPASGASPSIIADVE